jgi:hypothetical protein
MDIRRQLEQSRKWKAEVVKRRDSSEATTAKNEAKAAEAKAAA